MKIDGLEQVNIKRVLGAVAVVFVVIPGALIGAIYLHRPSVVAAEDVPVARVAQVAPKPQKVKTTEQKVYSAMIDRYADAVNYGTTGDACAAAGLVRLAAVQAHEEQGAHDWHSVEERACSIFHIYGNVELRPLAKSQKTGDMLGDLMAHVWDDMDE